MPRRYGADGTRLWNGKTPEEFTEADAYRFMAETEVKSSSLLEIRIPFPPPPEEALIMTGKPISFAMASPSSAVYTGSLLPGTTGTPACIMVFLASDLFPMRLMISADGPIKVMLHCWQSFAKRAFSDKNPNPG